MPERTTSAVDDLQKTEAIGNSPVLAPCPSVAVAAVPGKPGTSNGNSVAIMNTSVPDRVAAMNRGVRGRVDVLVMRRVAFATTI